MLWHRTKSSFIVFSFTFALGGLSTVFGVWFERASSEPTSFTVERTVTMPKPLSSSNGVKPLCAEAKREVELRSNEVLLEEISDLLERVRLLEGELVRTEAGKRSSEKYSTKTKIEAYLIELKVQIETRRLLIQNRKEFGGHGQAKYRDLLYRENCRRD